MGLEPYLLEKLVIIGNFEQTQKERVLDCIECGSCHFTCPSGRPLLDYIRYGKNRVSQIMRSKSK
jgi:electron transport complex protein RnfC